jgi:hypothetical protein
MQWQTVQDARMKGSLVGLKNRQDSLLTPSNVNKRTVNILRTSYGRLLAINGSFELLL